MENKISLFINYYVDENKERQEEIDFCLNENIKNKHLDKIYLLHDNKTIIPTNKKIVGIKIENRPTFRDFFDYANKIEGIKIISNTDIYYNDTISLSKQIQQNQVFALNRWDIHINGELIFSNRHDSQDAWIYKGNAENLDADFHLGKFGVDNVIAYELEKIGFNVFSPSYEIQAIHVHNTNIRNYNSEETLNDSRPFKILSLIKLKDIDNYKKIFASPDSQKKVSCLMLTYTRIDAAYNAIHSFLAQTYENKELIIINTGIPWYQKTLDNYIKCLDVKNIKHIIHFRRSSDTIGRLRNISMEHATGDYFCTWDDDDMYSRQRIVSEVYFLEKQNVDMVFYLNFKMKFKIPKQNYKVEYEQGLEPSILFKNPTDLGILYPDTNLHEDSLFIKDLYENYSYKKFVIDNDYNDYTYYCHSNNISSTNHFRKILKYHKNRLIN